MREPQDDTQLRREASYLPYQIGIEDADTADPNCQVQKLVTFVGCPLSRGSGDFSAEGCTANRYWQFRLSLTSLRVHVRRTLTRDIYYQRLLTRIIRQETPGGRGLPLVD
jgi:hypothetical protein